MKLVKIKIKDQLTNLYVLIISLCLISCSDFDCGDPIQESDEKYLSIDLLQDNDDGTSSYLLKSYKMVDLVERAGAYSCNVSPKKTEEAIDRHPMTVYYCAADASGNVLIDGAIESESGSTLVLEKTEILVLILTEKEMYRSVDYKVFDNRANLDHLKTSRDGKSLKKEVLLNSCFSFHNITKSSRGPSTL